jgi:hypothetical protein
MSMHHAACSCGNLSLTAEGEPVRISICHCYACQRRTGSAFGVQARFPRERIHVSGEACAYVRTADSGQRLHYHFCPTCGSTVYYQLERQPELIAVAVGAFADASFAAPKFSVWEQRKHAWVIAPAEAQCSA